MGVGFCIGVWKRVLLGVNEICGIELYVMLNELLLMWYRFVFGLLLLMNEILGVDGVFFDVRI